MVKELQPKLSGPGDISSWHRRVCPCNVHYSSTSQSFIATLLTGNIFLKTECLFVINKMMKNNL